MIHTSHDDFAVSPFHTLRPLPSVIRSSSFPTGNAILAPLVESDRCYLTLLTPKVLFRFYGLQKMDPLSLNTYVRKKEEMAHDPSSLPLRMGSIHKCVDKVTPSFNHPVLFLLVAVMIDAENDRLGSGRVPR